MNGRLLALALSLLISGVLSSCCLFGGHHDLPRAPTFHKPGAVSQVHRRHITDESFWHIDYGYDHDDRLMAIRMSTHITESEGPLDTNPTMFSVYRQYAVSPEGVITLIDESIRNNQTRESLQREVEEPDVRHWMTLEEAEREKNREMQTP